MLIVAPVMITEGAVLRLQHQITEKRLHSHDVRPPMTDTEWQNEVSGYGFPGFEGDANDFFRVEIVRSESKKGVAHERLRYRHPQPKNYVHFRAIDTKFRLVHVMSGCALFSHKVKVCVSGGLSNGSYRIGDLSNRR
jgi:dolichyl-phosphate-mannose-protein mannosyltransferase